MQILVLMIKNFANAVCYIKHNNIEYRLIICTGWENGMQKIVSVTRESLQMGKRMTE